MEITAAGRPPASARTPPRREASAQPVRMRLTLERCADSRGPPGRLAAVGPEAARDRGDGPAARAWSRMCAWASRPASRCGP